MFLDIRFPFYRKAGTQLISSGAPAFQIFFWPKTVGYVNFPIRSIRHSLVGDDLIDLVHGREERDETDINGIAVLRRIRQTETQVAQIAGLGIVAGG